MITFLIHKFVKDYERYEDPVVRERYGRVTSCVGIAINILLCVSKFIVGTLAHSVSITADAVNNLSDAGSSIISLISFKMSSRPADAEHPFGHERFEYVASMVVAFLILLVGVDLIRTSFDKVLHPEAITFSWVSILVLGISILAKFYMYSYNKKLGKKINSTMLEATAADSISDVMATGSVLIAAILSSLLQFQLDGYMGIFVAILIMKTGYDIVKSTLDELLGTAPPMELVENITNKLKTYDGVLGFHDLVIHSYGPSRCYVSVHVEVSSKENVLVSHDMIDNIEKDFLRDMNLQVVIHLDPIVTDDKDTNEMREYVGACIHELDPALSFHDFRMVPGETHTNVIFDIVVPFKFRLSDHEILAAVTKSLQKKGNNYFAVINFDREMTGRQG